MAQRLKGEMRAGDTAARVGGDEFRVLLDVAPSEVALAIAHRINATLHAPYEFGVHRYLATSSIGVATGSDGLATTDEMIAAADAAMHDAKRSGRGLCVQYSKDRHGPVAFVEVDELV